MADEKSIVFSQEEATRMYGKQLKAEGSNSRAESIAEKMLRARKYSDEEIVELTGLTAKELAGLKEKISVPA